MGMIWNIVHVIFVHKSSVLKYGLNIMWNIPTQMIDFFVET